MKALFDNCSKCFSLSVELDSQKNLKKYSGVKLLGLGWFDYLRPSKQFFSNVGRGHPGLNQY